MSNLIKLSKTPGAMWIPRQEATQVLTDGFAQLFGEKHRPLFDKYSEGLVDAGIVSGKEHYHRKGLNGDVLTHADYKFGDEATKRKLESQVSQFLTQKETMALLRGDDVRQTLSWKHEGIGEAQSTIIEELENAELKDKNPNFKYFKKFKLYKSISLHGEGGLDLNNWTKGNIDYRKEEGNFSYLLEDVALRYCGLGSFIGKNQLKEDWVNKGIRLIAPETDYTVVAGMFKSYLNKISSDFEEEVLVNVIKNNYEGKYGEKLESLKTHRETAEIVNAMTPEREKELLEAFEKRKAAKKNKS